MLTNQAATQFQTPFLHRYLLSGDMGLVMAPEKRKQTKKEIGKGPIGIDVERCKIGCLTRQSIRGRKRQNRHTLLELRAGMEKDQGMESLILVADADGAEGSRQRDCRVVSKYSSA